MERIQQELTLDEKMFGRGGWRQVIADIIRPLLNRIDGEN